MSTDMILRLFKVGVRLIIIALIIPAHECAHGLAARKLGDDTAYNMGRLTLNPLKHLDLYGTILMLFTGFGWAKPVPINAGRFKDIKKGMALTALAGPLANIVMAVILSIIYKLIRLFFGASLYVMLFFYIIISSTLALAVFNLIPIPPLDGSRLITAFLPDRMYFKLMSYERYIMIALMILMLTGVVSFPIGRLTSLLYNFVDNITIFLGRLPAF